MVGRGAAYADFDDDGDLDLLITENNGAARLLRNDNANENDALPIKTVGNAVKPRRHWCEDHTHDQPGGPAVGNGDDRFQLLVAERTSAHFRFGQAARGLNRQSGDCLAQRAKR
jgi:hypothetical protein